MEEINNAINDLFQRAQALPAPERKSFVIQQCGADIKLRDKLISMLEASASLPGPKNDCHSPDEAINTGDEEVVFSLTTNREPSGSPDSESRRHADDDPTAGWEQIGSYQIISRIGRGGQAVTYLARDLNLGRRVVLKQYLSSGNQLEQDAVLNEGRSLVRVRSTYVARCLTVERFENHYYLVMEYIPGKNLWDSVREQSFDHSRTAKFLAQLAEGLYAVHQAGILHRDIKPDNVIVSPDGTPRLIDFGLAAPLATEAIEAFGGTLAFMSPEQANSDFSKIDTRSDIFGLGAVLYWLLTGVPPYRSESITTVWQQARAGEYEDPLDINPGIPEPLERACLKAMRVSPSDRYSSAEEFARDLRQFLRNEPKQTATSSVAMPPKLGPNPYKGLAAFTELDADYYFGRDEQIERLWESFCALHAEQAVESKTPRVLPIIGPSGSGKSSLMRAGLLSELQSRPLPGRDKLRTIVITPGVRPIESLAAGLARLATDDPAPAAKAREFEEQIRKKDASGYCDGLRRVISLLPDIRNSPICLAIDQFEELYSLCDVESDRDVFVHVLLLAAQDRDGWFSMMFTLRTDFLGETRNHQDLNKQIAKHGLLVPSLSDAELRQAIVEPARFSHHTFSSAVVELLLDQTRGREGALPLLQFALTRIWEGLICGTDPGQTLREIGGVGGALAGEAQRIYDSLSPADQVIARRAFLGLVNLGEGTRDTRRRVPIRSLVAHDDSLDHVHNAIGRFSTTGARLITLSNDQEGNDTAEITHEAIFEHWSTLNAWLDDSREDIRLHHRLGEAAEHWDQSGRPEGLLWRSPDLDLMREYANRAVADLTESELAFYHASDLQQRQAAQRQRRRVRLVQTAAVVFAFMALGLMCLFWVATHLMIRAQNENQAKEIALADARTARQQAQNAYVDQLVESGLLAHEQAKPADAALWFSHAALQSEPDNPSRARLNRLRTQAWIEQAPLPISAFQLNQEPRRLWFSANGDFLLLEDKRRRFTLWDVKRSQQVELPLTEASAAAFSPNGLTLGIGNAQGQIQLLELPDLRASKTFDLEQRISALSFDHTGNLVAMGGKSLEIWDRGASQFFEGDFDLNRPAVYLVFDHSSNNLVAVDADENVVIAKLTKNSMDIDRAFPRIKHQVNSTPWGVSPCPPLITPTGQLVVRYPTNILESYQLGGGERTWRVALMGTITSVSLSNDGKYLALGRARQLELWKYGGLKATHVHSGNLHSSVATSIDSTDSLLAHGGYDRVVQVWNLEREGHRKFSIQHQGQVVDLAFASEKPELLATAQRDGLIHVWQLPNDLPDRRIVVGAPEHTVVTSPDAKYVMPGGNVYRTRRLKTTQVHETTSGDPVGPPLQPGGLLNGCSFAPDGRHAVTLSTLPAHADRTDCSKFDWDRVPGIVTFWNWRTGEKQGESLQTPSEPIGAEFLPDGKRLVVVCAAGQILLVHSESHKVMQTTNHQGSAVVYWKAPRRWLAVSPDNVTFASLGLGNWDSGPYLVKVWNADSGQALYAVEHDKWIYDASFSPDGKWLGTASADHSARIWDVTSGKEVAHLKHPHWVVTIQFDRSSTRLLTACLDGSARLWDWRNQVIDQEYMHDDEVKNAKLVMNDSIVAAVSNDGRLSFWSRATGRLIAPQRNLSGQDSNEKAEYLSVGPDGKHVVANGSSIYFDVFQVPDVTSIPETALSSVELQRMAELCAGLRIEKRSTVNMTSQTWLDKWQSLSNEVDLLTFSGTTHAIKSKGDQAQVEYERGVSLFEEREWADAIISFTHALAENPELGNAYYYRAYCFVYSQQDDKAVADFTRATRYGVVNANLYYLRAFCYLRLGKPAEALQDFFDWHHVAPPVDASQKRLHASRLLMCASRVGDRGGLADAMAALDMVVTDLGQVIEEDDPNSVYDYYDLACAYSLLAEYESQLGRPEPRINELSGLAVAALQKSTELGYSNAVHAHEDRDLAFVRRSPEFERIIGSIKKPFWENHKININWEKLRAAQLELVKQPGLSPKTGSIGPSNGAAPGVNAPKGGVSASPLEAPELEYQFLHEGMTEGALPYSDRTYKLLTVPDRLAGLSLLKTKMEHKGVVDERITVTLTAQEPTVLFLGIDERVLRAYRDVGPPAWLEEFRPVGLRLVTDDKTMQEMDAGYTIFAKEYAAGRIELGPCGSNALASACTSRLLGSTIEQT